MTVLSAKEQQTQLEERECKCVNELGETQLEERELFYLQKNNKHN